MFLNSKQSKGSLGFTMVQYGVPIGTSIIIFYLYFVLLTEILTSILGK